MRIRFLFYARPAILKAQKDLGTRLKVAKTTSFPGSLCDGQSRSQNCILVKLSFFSRYLSLELIFLCFYHVSRFFFLFQDNKTSFKKNLLTIVMKTRYLSRHSVPLKQLLSSRGVDIARSSGFINSTPSNSKRLSESS